MDATSRECNTTFATQLARCNDQRTSLHAQLLCKIFLSEGQDCSATMVAESHEVSCQPLLNRMEEVAGSEPLSDKGMRRKRGKGSCAGRCPPASMRRVRQYAGLAKSVSKRSFRIGVESTITNIPTTMTQGAGKKLLLVRVLLTVRRSSRVRSLGES